MVLKKWGISDSFGPEWKKMKSRWNNFLAALGTALPLPVYIQTDDKTLKKERESEWEEKGVRGGEEWRGEERTPGLTSFWAGAPLIKFKVVFHFWTSFSEVSVCLPDFLPTGRRLLGEWRVSALRTRPLKELHFFVPTFIWRYLWRPAGCQSRAGPSITVAVERLHPQPATS